MNNLHSFSMRPLSVLLALALCSASAWANKPEGPDHGKSKQQKHSQVEKQKHHKGERAQLPIGSYFVAGQRTDVVHYYDQQRKAGRCPPGLAKKNNGCMPPGQAKKWTLGQPLPGSVVFHTVPQAVIVKIGPPPAGHRYVRVANDLLLIAIGTQMVVDAIENLMAL